MKQKHLVIATDNFLPRWDGISRFLKELIPSLKKEYKITIIAPAFKGRIDPELIKGISLIRCKTLAIKFGDFNPSFPSFKKMKKVIETADIVFAQAIGPISLTASNYAKKFNKRLVAYVHSPEWDLFKINVNWFFKWLIDIMTKVQANMHYNKCDLVLVPSKEMKKYLKKVFITSKMRVVHLGVNVKNFVPAKDKQKAKKKIGFEKGTVVIGYCGRVAKEKNLETLYKAFNLLTKNNKKKNIKLLIVGGKEKLSKQFSNGNIIFAGSQDNVIPYLHAMDVYVLPSLIETSSLTTMEAMSCGLAVASTPVGLVKNYINNGSNGYLFPTKDYEKLYKILNRLVNHPKEIRTLGSNARRTAVKLFSWSKTVRAIMNSLEK